MARYYVNRETDRQGDHEVHTSTCSRLPHNRIDLGDHFSCYTAVMAAKQFFARSNGCYYCSTVCHTS